VIRYPKLGRERVVYLTPILQQAFKQYLKLRPQTPDQDYILVLRKCPPAGHAVRERLKYYARLAGVDMVPHQLRHTFATRLLNHGMSITSLRRLLGHKYLSSTQIYAHIYDEVLYTQFKTAMSNLEGIPVDEWPVMASSPQLLDSLPHLL
jgi:site-specific recombinase XerD